MSKILGFLLGIAVALAGPAAYGVVVAPGGIVLSQKELALAFAGYALVLWIIVSGFSGAAALGAAIAFGTMSYAVLQIPNRMTDFLRDVPGVRETMIDGVKATVLSGLVPVLAVVTLVFAIQGMVLAARRRRLRLAEEARLAEEEQAAAIVAQRREQYAATRSSYAAHDHDHDHDHDDDSTREFGAPHRSGEQSRDDDETAEYAQRMDGDQTQEYYDPNRPPTRS
jgi:hypothetical protein